MRCSLVLGTSEFELETLEALGHEQTVVAKVNGSELWQSTEPGWREIRVGVSGGNPYFWSAHAIVSFDLLEGTEPRRLEVAADEILVAFRVGPCWIAVCETSVQLVGEAGATDIFWVGEVILKVAWRADYSLVVTDANDVERIIRVDVDRFVLHESLME